MLHGYYVVFLALWILTYATNKEVPTNPLQLVNSQLLLLAEEKPKIVFKNYYRPHWNKIKRSHIKVPKKPSKILKKDLLSEDTQKEGRELRDLLLQELSGPIKNEWDPKEHMKKLFEAIEKSGSQFPISQVLKKYRGIHLKANLTVMLNNLDQVQLSKLAQMHICEFQTFLSIANQKDLLMDVIAHGFQSYKDNREPSICRKKMLRTLNLLTQKRWRYLVPKSHLPKTSYVGLKTLSSDKLLAYLKSPFVYTIFPAHIIQEMAVKIISSQNSKEIIELLQLNLIPNEIVRNQQKAGFVWNQTQITGALREVRDESLRHIIDEYKVINVVRYEGKVTDPTVYRHMVRTKQVKQQKNIRMNFLYQKNEEWKQSHHFRKTQSSSLECPEGVLQDIYMQSEFYLLSPEDLKDSCQRMVTCPSFKLWNFKYERFVWSTDVVSTMCPEDLAKSQEIIRAFRIDARSSNHMNCEHYSHLKNSPILTTTIVREGTSRPYYMQLLECARYTKIADVINSDLIILNHRPLFTYALIMNYSKELPTEVTETMMFDDEPYNAFLFKIVTNT